MTSLLLPKSDLVFFLLNTRPPLHPVAGPLCDSFQRQLADAVNTLKGDNIVLSSATALRPASDAVASTFGPNLDQVGNASVSQDMAHYLQQGATACDLDPTSFSGLAWPTAQDYTTTGQGASSTFDMFNTVQHNDPLLTGEGQLSSDDCISFLNQFAKVNNDIEDHNGDINMSQPGPPILRHSVECLPPLTDIVPATTGGNDDLVHWPLVVSMFAARPQGIMVREIWKLFAAAYAQSQAQQQKASWQSLLERYGSRSRGSRLISDMSTVVHISPCLVRSVANDALHHGVTITNIKTPYHVIRQRPRLWNPATHSFE